MKRISRVERVIPRGASSQVDNKQMVIGAEGWEATSPFLFLSEDWFAPPGGFEEHPHRGMQTVTIILEGALEHRDHTGAHGILKAGDVQWMTAGRGVLHSEMPQGPVHTLQLWLNLPAKMKMIPARYQDQRLADTPIRKIEGGEVRVYAGRSGECRAWPRQRLSDVAAGCCPPVAGDGLAGGTPELSGFRLRPEGKGEDRRQAVQEGEVAWFEPGEGELSIAAEEDFRGLLFAGEPIREPAVAYGPFVMNTEREIQQAFMDYQSGRLVA